MLSSDPGHTEIGIPAPSRSGLAGRALLGWMEREQAVKFLTQDCLFSAPLTPDDAEEIWKSHKAIVDNLPPVEPLAAGKLAMSAADLKAARKFRNKYPGAAGIVDFVRLNPMDLVVHQHWISTAIADGYRDKVTPDKWLLTALLDPPSNPRLKSRSAGDDITFDLPHAEFFLTVPSQPNEIRVSEGDGFVTVAVHADRALLLRGYHRTFACAQFAREAVNAPHGVLFAVSDQLASIGSLADEVLGMMAGPRPPRMADFFDDRFFLPVTLRKRRYQMRIHCEVAEIDYEEEDRLAAGKSTLAVTQAFDRTSSPDRGASAQRNFQAIFEEALRHQAARRLDSAISLYERALFLRPDSADVHNNLGLAVMVQGRVDDAVAHFEHALALDPDHVSAHTNLGVALAAQGKVDQARVHHERALAINPDHAHAHVELGNVFKYQGRFGDALAEYGRAIAIRPDYADAHVMRADVKTFHAGDADLSALEALAARGDLTVDQAATIHFALHKALEDCKDYSRAFEHLRKGNDLKRRLIEYNEPHTAEFFRRVATVFDRGLLERFQGEGDPSSVPIFVVGMPRSGSSLIERILASHPQIHGAGELWDLDAAVRIVQSAGGRQVPYPECVPALDAAALRRMGQTYLARLPAVADGKIRIVDKMPGNYLKIGLIRMILPNARIIHTVRDPVDNCVSCYSKLFSLGHPFTYDLAELGRHYRLYTEMMAHWRSVLPPGGMLDVSYEEVVDDLEGQARRLIDYCGLPWDDRCLSFHESTGVVRTASAIQVRQPLFRSSLQRWRKYEAGLGPLLRELGDLVRVGVQS
jgi:tetratricopeptide (TPR) repeat protein